jgi:hypothetical protein
MLEAVD